VKYNKVSDVPTLGKKPMKTLFTFFLLIMATPIIAQKNMAASFAHTVETTAAAEEIWQIWTDVPGWKNWDTELKNAHLQAPFGKGARGIVFPVKGPRSGFEIIEVIGQKSYTFKTKLPLGALYVKRYLSAAEGKTTFTHQVWFTGLSKAIFARALGRKYQTVLPQVMENIRNLAEEGQ
jgi:hypothetical protein